MNVLLSIIDFCPFILVFVFLKKKKDVRLLLSTLVLRIYCRDTSKGYSYLDLFHQGVILGEVFFYFI